MDPAATLALSVAVFVATNVDDILLLAAFFAAPAARPVAIVLGQYLGIGTLVAVSAAAAQLAVAVPPGWVGLLGVVPLWLGLRSLAAAAPASEAAVDPTSGGGLGLLAVAGVTVANGGDNLGAYIPLFAASPGHILTHAAVFALMTAVWCGLANALVCNRWSGGVVRRFGRIALPFVLIGLGLYILADATVLIAG